MITIIRKNQRWLLLLVAILTIIAFAWLYNTTDTERLGENKVAQMYGRTIYRVEVDRAVRLRQLAGLLGMQEFVGRLTALAQSEEAALEEFVWNLLVVQHEAKANWIRATDEQVLDKIRSLPALSTNGTFDRNKYVMLLQEQLLPRGLTERHLEDLIRDSLALDMLEKIVTSPVGLTEKELAERKKMFQRVDLTLVKIPPAEKSETPEITEEAVAKYFEANKAGLLTPLLRSVEYAKLSLPPEQAALEGRERIEALQKVADRISTLHEQLLLPGADFAALSKEAGAEVVQTPNFDNMGNVPGANPAEPGAPVGLPQSVVAQVFRARPDMGVSDILQDGDSFYIFRVTGETPQRPLTLEEATPRIRESLAMEAEQTAEQERARGFRKTIVQALADGRPLADVANENKLNVQTLTGLEPWAQAMDFNAFYARSAADLEEGEVGELQRGPEGWYFLRLDKRHPVDEALWAEREPQVRESLLANKRGLLFFEWLRQAREASNLRFFARG